MEPFEALEAGDPRQVGRYRIVARLGAGGMGRVYLGRSPGGRFVAVKVVRPELAEDAGFRRRFAREVAAARRVNGAFTAGVVDADPDGSPAWLATVYVPGVPLGDAVAAHGPWPQAEVFALGAGLAEALEAIHAADVVHRDLKPSNILLAADGPRVIDFGISVAGEASALTRTGTVVGTPGFMSPEQLTGKRVGPASDVFALGAVLAFTATGSGPFGTGSAHALSFRVVYEEPDLHQLPPVLRTLVASCLAKEPDRRPTVTTLLHELADTSGGRPAVPPASTPTASTRTVTEPGWLPEPVAATVHSRTAAVPPPPAPPPASPETSEPPPTEPVPAEPGAGRPERPATTRPREQHDFIVLPPGARLPSLPPVKAAGRPAGITRRRTLLGLGGATAAGLGFVGWKIRGSGSSAPGEQRWLFRAGGSLSSSPAVAGGVVFVGSGDDNLYAVDAATGKRRWTFPTGGAVLSSPAVVGGVVYIGSVDESLYAVDAASGEKRWRFRTGNAVESSPAVARGVVFVGSHDGNLYAVDAASGEKRWRFRTGGAVSSSPAVAGGVVFVASGDGNLYAVDAASGKRRWTFPTGWAVRSSPAVAGGVVFVGSQDGNLYAVDAATGKRRWKFPTQHFVSSSPAVAGGVVYVGSEDGNLYAVDAASGEKRWRFRTGGAVLSSPAVAGGVVYVGSKDGNLYAVDAASGEKRWYFHTARSLYEDPAVADGMVYIAGGDAGVLYAVTL
ncbi:outer membrane protein assembly factor BamB family protein [Streptomyces canus]|uniref:Outer membrane protein assembly factor BamB/serine/threonine protein kinase n=1 Tax=Streptomyces canus TaxID=58343 RepID=A0AAW8FHF9_9ACTN|nr:PQQ-binding-like beta-propeller repeat protein [Streptomyces canus]MDQ0762858.1 outer membrane protein assembly factor BamB/serine/threonine protein kinase [Streptomyces canus]MDQ0908685.1 outer membrane protein assembly factor BamB/serine/threonine protein kinase [Streptomyces canus]